MRLVVLDVAQCLRCFDSVHGGPIPPPRPRSVGSLRVNPPSPIAVPTRKTISRRHPVEIHRLPAAQKSVISPSGYLSESWTDRPDAWEILGKCAAHIRAAEVPRGECSDARSPEWLSGQAAEILNACELQLKKESLLAADRIEKQNGISSV